MKKKKLLKLKTRSIWGYPPQRFFRYLNMLDSEGLSKTLCIIGCSDGTYVVPAARRGFEVCAVDMNKASIYGGYAKIMGRRIKIEGLISRVNKEGVQELVEVVDKDFMKYSTNQTYSGVFTSGSIHYRENGQYSIESLLNKIKSFVSVGGILLFEYIHRSQTASDPSRHYLTTKEIEPFFKDSEWIITSHKTKGYTEPPNPRNSSIHKIVWGRLYATKGK